MSRPGVATGNDSVKDNVGAIFALRPLKTLRIAAVLIVSVRSRDLDRIAAAVISFRPEFSRRFDAKYLSTVVRDAASAIGHDGVTGPVNLEH